MKKIILAIAIFLIPTLASAYVSPGRPTGYVNDFAGVISAAERQMIEEKLTSLYGQSGAQVAVVTVRTTGDDETIETYAVKLFEDWGIGDAERDRGLLLLVAVDDRAVRIEVGYGLEGDVTDIHSANVIRDILTPAFREGQFAAGVSSAVDALSAIILKSPEAAQYAVPPTQRPASGGDRDYFALIFFAVIGLNVLASILGKTKSWWLGGVLGAGVGVVIGLIWGWVPVGLTAVVVLGILGLIFDYIVSKHPPKGGGRGGRDWWVLPLILSGGGRHGGGFGGGFGGFGGGMSGGGGASGRW